jgi:hypothetical protein
VVESCHLDWWVKERQQWWGRVRGADGRQRWIRAVDLRPAKESRVAKGIAMASRPSEWDLLEGSRLLAGSLRGSSVSGRIRQTSEAAQGSRMRTCISMSDHRSQTSDQPILFV